MKIAITSDNHLRRKDEHPERWNALQDILRQTEEFGIETLIVAGDLFDKDYANYSEIDSLIENAKIKDCYIIPGNHDYQISQKHFASTKVNVFSETTLRDIDHRQFLFVPFLEGKKIGEEIIRFDQLEKNKWVLIGHGDFLNSGFSPNVYEKGVYMPITRSDIQIFSPAKVILGHIHIASNLEQKVVYCGSPCSIDTTETGYRRFIILDTANLDVIEKNTCTDVLYFKEEFFVLPVENEEEYLMDQVTSIISKWSIKEPDIEKSKIEIKVFGFTADKSKVGEIVTNGFKNYKWLKPTGPDLTEVSLCEETDKMYIAKEFLKEIKDMELPNTIYLPTMNLIANEGLKKLFG